MERVIFIIVFLWSSVFAMSEEAQQIGAKFAAMKDKTHRTLTAAKDVAPLIERIDKDLSALHEKKKQLAMLKQSLIIKKQDLQKLVDQKISALGNLEAQFNQTNAHLGFQIGLLNGLSAQRSIQFELHLVAQEATRATLLADVFSTKLMSSSLIAWSEQRRTRLSCYLVEDVRG
jgi:hypothetical protein